MIIDVSITRIACWNFRNTVILRDGWILGFSNCTETLSQYRALNDVLFTSQLQPRILFYKNTNGIGTHILQSSTSHSDWNFIFKLKSIDKSISFPLLPLWVSHSFAKWVSHPIHIIWLIFLKIFVQCQIVWEKNRQNALQENFVMAYYYLSKIS